MIQFLNIYYIDKKYYFSIHAGSKSGNYTGARIQLFKADFVFRFEDGIYDKCFKYRNECFCKPKYNQTLKSYLKEQNMPIVILLDRHFTKFFKGTTTLDPYNAYITMEELLSTEVYA